MNHSCIYSYNLYNVHIKLYRSRKMVNSKKISKNWKDFKDDRRR